MRNIFAAVGLMVLFLVFVVLLGLVLNWWLGERNTDD